MGQSSSGKLGFTACVMLLIGAMVGSAIFSLSGLTMFTAGPAAVLSWIGAGILMLLYGAFMGELACRYPKSGGVYYFPRLAFPGETGKVLGWLSCWSFILTNVVAVAFSAIYVGQYLAVAFPGAAHAQLPLAIGSLVFCLLLNLIRVDLAGRINAAIVLMLLAAMGIYIGAAFFGGSYSPEMLSPFFSQGADGPFGFLRAVPIAVIGYSGIVALAFMVSDVRDAQKTLPRAMFFSVSVVALLYALMILATLGLISGAYLADHPEMRFIPIFCACITKLGAMPYLVPVVSIAAVLALTTTMLVCISMNARAIRAAAEDGLLPAFLGRSTSGGVPGVAAGLTCLVSAGYACFPEHTQQIVNFGAIFNALTMILTMLALIRSRRNAKPCAFTVRGGAVLPYAVLGILLACDLGEILTGGSRMYLHTAFFLLAGAGILLFSRRRS